MFCIRRMREEDLADVARLEKEIFSDPWSENAIRRKHGTVADAVCCQHWRMVYWLGYLIVYYV